MNFYEPYVHKLKLEIEDIRNLINNFIASKSRCITNIKYL